MHYFSVAPTGILKRYVKQFWFLEGTAIPERPYLHNIFADTCTEILFYYKGNFHELELCNFKDAIIKTGIAGQTEKNRKLITDHDFGVFGVYLYPFSISQLFGIEAVQLKNQMFDLKTILGKEADELEEKMILAKCNESRLNIVKAFLEKKAIHVKTKTNTMIDVMQRIQQVEGNINIEELARSSAISSRQLERNFLAFSGLSPKLFARIVRFQSALKKHHQFSKPSTKIAYETGYYDQAHFINDFKKFSGLKPNEFVKYYKKDSLWLS